MVVLWRKFEILKIEVALFFTSQTSKASLCDQSLALWKRTKAPLRGVPPF